MEQAPPIEKVVAALKSGNPVWQRKALSIIARFRMAGTIEHLRVLLSSGVPPDIRYLAGKVLNFLSLAEAQQAAPSPAPPPQATGDPFVHSDPRIRLQAVMQATKKNATGLFGRIQALAQTETHPFVRSALPIALIRLGGKESLSFVVRIFLGDQDARVRANATEALGTLDDLRGCPFLVKMLSDPDNRVRANAIVALQKFPRPHFWRILKAMTDSQQVWMRDSAAFALGRIPDPQSLPLLAKLLKDPQVAVAVKARNALEEMARQGVDEADFLLAEVADVPKQESWESLMKLAKQAEDGMDGFDSGLPASELPAPPDGEPDFPFDSGITTAVGIPDVFPSAEEGSSSESEPAPPEPEMEFELDSPDAAERIAQIDKAVSQGGAGAATALAERIASEPDPAVLIALARALGNLKATDQASHLKPLFSHESADVAKVAVQALAAMEDESLFSYLIPLLKRSNAPGVRAEAAVALRNCEYADAMGTLKDLVKSQKLDNGLLALSAACRIATPHTIDILELLAKDPRVKLKDPAIEALLEHLKSGSRAAKKALDRLGLSA